MATGEVAELVAEELEAAAVATRRLDGRLIGSFTVGVGVGVTIGFVVGYRYSKKKLRMEIYEEAEQEIASIREHYQQKIIAAEAQDKQPVEAIIKEKGYDAEDEEVREIPRIEYARLDDPKDEVRPLPAPVPVSPPSIMSKPVPTDSGPRVFRTRAARKDKDDNWDYDTELEKRDEENAYIIHQDEFDGNESGYDQVTYIYYMRDDILVDDGDTQTPLINRENLIGNDALNRFGHGADDYNVVHVRNPELQLEFVINRVPVSWEVEALGLDPNDSP